MKYTKESVREILIKASVVKTPAFKVPVCGKLIENMRQSIILAEMRPTHLCVSARAWLTLCSDLSIQMMLDPVTDRELIGIGVAGTLLGLDILVDAGGEFLAEDVMAVIAANSPVDTNLRSICAISI